MAPAQVPPRTHPFSALTYRNFRLMWISLLVSNSGTWLQNVAQDYLVYQITGKAVDLGYTNIARALALILLSFVGGTIVDRVDKRKLLLCTQSAFAALAIVLGLLVQLHVVAVWHVVLLSFLNAALLALDQPARQALVPSLVPREQLMNAVALNSVAFTGAAAFGPALAGPVVALLGIAWGFYLNAFSFLAVIGAVWVLKLPPRPPVSGDQPSIRSAVYSGLRYVGSNPAILLLVSLLTVFNFFSMPYQALLPVFAAKVFGGGVDVLGYLRAAPGIGALVGGFILASMAQYPRKERLVLGGSLGFAGLLLGFTLTRSLLPALVLLFVASTLFTIFQSSVQTLMQQITSNEMRGRVMSLYAITAIGMQPLGAGPMSLASDHLGVSRSVAVGTVIAACFALWAAFRGTLSQLRPEAA